MRTSWLCSLVADLARHQQAGIAGFHDDVQQHQRDIGRIAQHVERFLAAVGMQEAEPAAQEAGIAEGEFGDDMHVHIIVHNQHTPAAARRGVGVACAVWLLGRLVFYHPIGIVVVLIHASSPS
jgi:hypothetical protein